MIVTCKKQVPFDWVIFSILPWAALVYQNQVMGAAFIFSLKKFVDNPAGLTLILSLPGFISLLTAPLSSFLSDRIWTRFGRRKPFIISAWTCNVLCMLMIPLAPNFWMLIICFVIYGICNDIGQPIAEVINQEIVPPHQRGRATAGMQWCSNLASLVFYFVALGRFDDVQFMAGVPITGETAIYWSGAMLLAVMMMLLMLGVKELNPHSSLRGQSLSVRNFFSGILDRDLWPVYTLIFGAAMLSSGLGAMGNLLYTEQWNYTKQDMGINVAVGTTLNLFLIALLGMVADKFNRIKAYQILIAIALTIKLCYFCYLEFVLPDHRPTLLEIIFFGEMLSVVSILTGVVYTPLVYDYVTRNKMGTYSAGASMISRITHLITLNGLGLFVWFYAVLFQPPAGEMVRIVVHRDMPQAEITSILRAANWALPQDDHSTSAMVDVRNWNATGATYPSGNCWEIRLRDASSEKLATQKESLEKEASLRISQINQIKDTILKLEKRNNDAAELIKQQHDQQKQLDQINHKIRSITETLDSRADHFKTQVHHALGDQILADGQQIHNASIQSALVLEWKTTVRPDSHLLEKMLVQFRLKCPQIIDLRPEAQGDTYGISLSLLLDPGADANQDESLAQMITNTLITLPDHADVQNVIVPDSISYRHAQATILDLQVVENPVDSYVSPIMRVAYGIQSLFMDPPSSTRRLTAIGRTLRSNGIAEHIAISADANKTVRVIALLNPTTEDQITSDDEVSKRIKLLLQNAGDPDHVSQINTLYRNMVDAAATQRLTIARPFVAASYARMKYDYVCGYIWMFMLGLVGLTVAIIFGRRERNGLIRKWGVEEARAS